MKSTILYCPHLDRDLRGILKHVHNPRILTGYPTERGEDGCLEMHKAAIREALSENLPALWVMEDDCDFTSSFSFERWCEDVHWAEAKGFDCLVGGCVKVYDPKVVQLSRDVREAPPVRNFESYQTGKLRVIIECSSFHSAHCIVYFRSGYERILENAIQPYDVSIGRDCGLKCAMVYPFVAEQKPSFSGILKTDVDYTPLYRQYEVLLGQELRLI